MTTTVSRPTDTAPASASSADVTRRAMLLCVPAEPHTDSWPCARHLREARHQVLSSPRMRPVAAGAPAPLEETSGSGYWV